MTGTKNSAPCRGHKNQAEYLKKTGNYQKISRGNKWCPGADCIPYALRQLKSPLSNINRLDNHLVMSTGTFVILGVILAET